MTKNNTIEKRTRSKHGMTESREYLVWWRIKQQCRNRNRAEYPRIGAKGIDLCPEWNNFNGFLKDMGQIPFDCNTIERIDESLNFSKANCKWAYRALGRPTKPKEAKVNKKSIKKIKKPTLLSVTIESDLLDYIRRVAIQKSAQIGKVVTANDLIRECISKDYPILCQTDIFGDTVEKQSA